MRYPVVIHQEGNSAFGVTVPDIVGCFSAGDTIEEAMENVKEAIYDHLELVIGEGGEISAASRISDLKKNTEYVDVTWALVDVDLEDLLGPAERINITIPRRALQKIDNAAKYVGETRSGFVTRAALELINPREEMRRLYGASFVEKSLASGPRTRSHTTAGKAEPAARVKPARKKAAKRAAGK